jgi:uncharacterized membrane protein
VKKLSLLIVFLESHRVQTQTLHYRGKQAFDMLQLNLKPLQVMSVAISSLVDVLSNIRDLRSDPSSILKEVDIFSPHGVSELLKLLLGSLNLLVLVANYLPVAGVQELHLIFHRFPLFLYFVDCGLDIMSLGHILVPCELGQMGHPTVKDLGSLDHIFERGENYVLDLSGNLKGL